MTLGQNDLDILARALAELERGFGSLPDTPRYQDRERVEAALMSAARRMQDNFPYHHPLYVGQMLKPPHPVARLAYALSLWINPNNHALDGGRASSAMEKEAVAAIAAMFGWDTYLGHLCGGGTMANFEALWISRELNPGAAVVASSQSHYTHPRLSQVLGVPFHAIDVTPDGKINVEALRATVDAQRVGTVVVTLGTSGAGAVDPLRDILSLRDQYGFRVHVDTAYGGYFRLATNLSSDVRDAFDCIGEADSIVVDPHKHGLQPYGCGCVLFRDPGVGRFYRHDSPYTYFSSPDLHLGEISLECSRPGASAVALWTTMQMLPLEQDGEFARSLEACRDAALNLHGWLAANPRFEPLMTPQLDLVVWCVRAATASEASARARQLFDAAARQDLHVAVATFPRVMVEPCGAVQSWDQEQVACLRASVMKPEHGEWMEEITSRLDAAASGLW